MLKGRLWQRKSEGWNASCTCETGARASVPEKEKMESDSVRNNRRNEGLLKERQRVELLSHCCRTLCRARARALRLSDGDVVTSVEHMPSERSLQKKYTICVDSSGRSSWQILIRLWGADAEASALVAERPNEEQGRSPGSEDSQRTWRPMSSFHLACLELVDSWMQELLGHLGP
jgi:hypothetical protein